MDDSRTRFLGRRDFLAAGGACLAAPLIADLAAHRAVAESFEAGLGRRLFERPPASIGYWPASEDLADLSAIVVSGDGPDSETSTVTDAGSLFGSEIVPARQVAPKSLGRQAKIRVAGCVLPQPRGRELPTISMDILFDTAHGKLPVHVLHADCLYSGVGGSGGEMVLPVVGRRLAITAGTRDSQESVLEIPARRGVYVVGWRDPRTGASPRWRSLHVESHNDTIRLVTSLGRRPDFPYAVLTLDRSLA